jgi:hypothetical protein
VEEKQTCQNFVRVLYVIEDYVLITACIGRLDGRRITTNGMVTVEFHCCQH